MNGYAIRFIYDAANLHRGAFFSALGLVFVVKVIGLSLPLVTGRLIDSLNFVTGLSPAEWLFVFIGFVDSVCGYHANSKFNTNSFCAGWKILVKSKDHFALKESFRRFLKNRGERKLAFSPLKPLLWRL